MVDTFDLFEFLLVVSVLYRRVAVAGRGDVGAGVGPHHALGYQHVVQSYYLGVRRVLRSIGIILLEHR